MRVVQDAARSRASASRASDAKSQDAALGWRVGFVGLAWPAAEGAAAPAPGAVAVAAYDTRRFAGFQGRGGSAFSLARLAREHLGLSIQAGAGGGGGGDDGSSSSGEEGAGQQQQRRRRQRASSSGGSCGGGGGRAQHDAVEDARALMALWLRVARPALLLDAAAGGSAAAYDALVALRGAALLAPGPGDDDGDDSGGAAGA